MNSVVRKEPKMQEGTNEALVLRCEDSLEGMFTAVYDAFVYKNQQFPMYHDNISIAIGDGEMTLFAQERVVKTDAAKVEKTVRSIQNRLGYQTYDTILLALCHFSGDRASAVLGYLVRAFAQGRNISEQLADPFVLRVMELSRKVNNERDKLYGFVRFQDLGSILVAMFAPKCNLVPLMMDHFSDRLPNENFILYDEGRKLAAVHEKGKTCVLVSGDGFEMPKGQMDAFAALWKQYVATMEIKERHNEKCQNNLLPKWYRRYMTEWN